jgi:hypothetical protein
MDRYIEQLVEDLEQVAANPPVPPYIEPPAHMEDFPELAALALTPYKSLSEWTGIDEEAFPSVLLLTLAQAAKVNAAILKVFESMNIELIDAPHGLPPDVLYDALTMNWDYQIQYLPDEGFDLQLCTGDPDTCPYGDLCDCGDPPPEEEGTPNSPDWDLNMELPF